jgi:pentatricopeptide repeat protein
MQSAEEVVERMLESNIKPDTISFNTLMFAYARKGDLVNVHKIFDRLLQSGNQPSDLSYAILVNAHGHMGEFDKMKLYYDEMKLCGFKPSPKVLRSIAEALIRFKNHRDAAAWQKEIEDCGVLVDTNTTEMLKKLAKADAKRLEMADVLAKGNSATILDNGVKAQDVAKAEDAVNVDDAVKVDDAVPTDNAAKDVSA